MANEYVVNYADLKAVADAIRTKSGVSDMLAFPNGFVDTVGAIQTGGDEYSFFRELMNNNMTDIVLPNDIISLRTYVFYRYTKLESIKANNVTRLGEGAFSNCTALTHVELNSLNYIYGAKVAFQKCTSLESISLPAWTDFGSSSTRMFENCTALKHVNLPVAKGTGIQTFLGCTALEFIDLPKVENIGTQAFSSCSSLKKIVLRHTAVVTLGNVNAFQKTPFASDGTGGTVYVPQALIGSYQTATNWSNLYAAGTCTFVAIEGSEYE